MSKLTKIEIGIKIGIKLLLIEGIVIKEINNNGNKRNKIYILY
jgi:hypothetical protein